jgi:hypothetical protein
MLELPLVGLPHHLSGLHGLEVLGHLEWCFGLALDLVDGDAVGDLDQGQAVGEVDVEDGL